MDCGSRIAIAMWGGGGVIVGLVGVPDCQTGDGGGVSVV